MSESELLMTYRKESEAVKTREPSSSGMSLRETCLLRRRRPVYRRHEPGTGFSMERENLRGDVKGKPPSGGTPRGRIPMRRAGAEQPVVAMKRLQWAGSEGAALSCWFSGSQPEMG